MIEISMHYLCQILKDKNKGYHKQQYNEREQESNH